MICPFCQNNDSKVLDSRPDNGGKSIRRRRECLACAKRWRTIERIEDQMPLVIKRNGTYEPYERAKLLESMKVSCGKRPVTIAQIENSLSEIEWGILEAVSDEISTAYLGEQVMKALRILDEIAYVRYASVYRRFKDVGELMAEMQSLVQPGEPVVTP